MAQATLASRPLVSVVTPFYNTAPYLAQCIESVLAQTYPHFEYILMDNCSTDGSAEIAETYARPGLHGYASFDARSSFPSSRTTIVHSRRFPMKASTARSSKLTTGYSLKCLQLMVRAFKQVRVDRSGVFLLVDRGAICGGSGFPLQTPMLYGQRMPPGGFCSTDITPVRLPNSGNVSFVCLVRRQ